MEPKTLAETIKAITRWHLEENGGLLMGQSITAVGWCNGTVPDCKGIIELPMTDVAGAGFAVGAAMVGKRPIFVIRFQDFLVLNGSPLINYAAKCRELHGHGVPVFIRAMASDLMGPVHSGVLHSMYMHFPGFRVCSPMTPGEYEQIWADYMQHDDPMFVSEHRSSYSNTQDLPDVVGENATITIYGISASRFALREAARMMREREGVTCNLINILWLKPFELGPRHLEPLRQSGLGLVVDASFEICGASRSIAYELATASGCPVRALGLQDHAKCLCPPLQNKTPDANAIYAAARELVKEAHSKPVRPSGRSVI